MWIREVKEKEIPTNLYDIKIFHRKRFFKKPEYKYIIYHSDGAIYDESPWIDISEKEIIQDASQVRFNGYDHNLLR